jgi:hypothetical protein
LPARRYPNPAAVLQDGFYRELAAQVDQPLGLFTRNMPCYDALGYSVTSADDGPLGLFHFRAWHDLIAGVMGGAATGDLDIALHHHEPNSENGTVHSDLNPGWFVDEGRPDGITMADPARCGYWHGSDAVGAASERVRAVAVLFSVGNEPWRPGDGGETGLYETADLPVDRPSVAVPPVNNRFLAL